jgi:transcriptional regulator with XRE-family HTH domain
MTATFRDALPRRPVSELLREWRERRRLSQLELATQADISTRHLSFVETGRSRPTSDMILRITEQLDVPLRERNQALLAGGYAPAYAEHRWDAPQLREIRAAFAQVLSAHEPFPAVLVDRTWTMLDANLAIDPFLAGCAAHLLAPPVNVLRLSLHPDGMAPRIVNLAEWRAHILDRLDHQISVTADPELVTLAAELRAYPCDDHPIPERGGAGAVVVPLQLRTERGVLSLFSMTAMVGTPLDVTVAELAIESFFPANAATAQGLQAIAGV